MRTGRHSTQSLALLLAAVCMPLASAQAKSPFDDAVAAWHMADGADSAGKNSQLKTEGDVQLGVELEGADREASLQRGGDGKVASFKGGYLDAGQGAADELNVKSNALTVALRLRSPSGRWGDPLMSKHGGPSKLAYNIFSANTGYGPMIGAEVGNDAIWGMHQVMTSLAPLGPTAWHDVVVRWDGATLQLYVDGALRDQETAIGAPRQKNAEPCLIGAESYQGKTKSGFRGLIDHAALWDRALSDAEIAKLSGVTSLSDKRPTYYNEKYRPQFHFTAQKHWINDPNGMFFYQGVYHLCFQHWPPGRTPAYKDWGHAVSSDLVHWKQLASALTPHKVWGGCWSGSAVVDEENTSGFQNGKEKPIVLIVTDAGEPNVPPPSAPNTQCIAYSTDGGQTFTYYDKNPVIGHIVACNRDPKVVWHAPSKQWIMVFFLDGNNFAMHSSPDLKHWTRLPDVKVPGSSECPDFFELPVDGNPANTRWVFWTANGRFLLGTFDGKAFHKEGDLLQADYGANFYAAQTFSDIPKADGRRIQIAWMAGGQYPGMPFTQQLSFPCVLTLKTTPDGIRMFRQPVKEIEALREKERHWQDLDLKPGDDPLAEGAPAGGYGDLLEIEAEIAPGDAAQFGFDLRGYKVEYNVKEQKVVTPGRTAKLALENGRIKLHVLVDRTSVELFGNDGRLSMSSCFLPHDDNKTFTVFSKGGTAKIVSLKVYQLKSSWSK